MKLEFTGRQTEIPEGARKLAERKLGKIAKILTGANRAHIVVSAEGHRRIVEITVYSRRRTLTALEESNDIALSLATAVEKLERQVEKHKGRIESQRKVSLARGVSVRRRPTEKAAEAPVPPPSPTVRRRSLVAPEMSLAKATEMVQSGGEPVVIFRDRESERLSILFRRKDGRLSLIEPE
jgi:putative sigma-54 modulation protein